MPINPPLLPPFPEILTSPAMYNPATPLPPGFRFHPTDEELIVHYLKKQTAAPRPPHDSIITQIDIYKFDPWDLPEKAIFGDREWYFFTPRDRKYPNGLRPNRAAVSGYWKATGTDKAIVSAGKNVGVKKSLVFYKGKPPKGLKTNWIMHEYRLAESQNSNNNYRSMSMRFTENSMRLDDWVLCRIYKKRKHIPPQINDQEQGEYYCADDAYFPTQKLPQKQSLLNLPKTSAIPEFLEDFSQLSNSLIGHPISSLNLDNNAANAYFLPQLSQIESSDERNIKEETNGSLLNFSGKFDDSQYYFLT